MGSDQSKTSREREFEKLEREREELRRARTEQLQEITRLEKEKNLYRRARQDLEARQLQEALRKYDAETQSQLYPNLNHIAGASTNETYHTNAAPNLAIRHDHFRYQPSAPPAPVAPTLVTETRAAPPRPRPPTIKLATETGAVAPQPATVRTSATTPQSATVRSSATTPQSATVRASATAPQPATVRASVTEPREKKVFTRKDNNQSCCQSCKKPYEDKIFQCKNGHSACQSCWSLDVPCGLCKGPITNVRNFELENHITANRSVKCPNAADGCKLSFKKPELAKHEKECPFKELKCPAVENCNWKGKLRQLSIHFDEEHPLSRQANVDTEMCLPNISNERITVQLIKLGTYNFLFYVKVSEIERCVYMDIQLIGTKISSSKWFYEIHVYNKRQPRRKYQYVNTCQSSNETDGISILSCAVLPLSYAWSFVNESNLTYKIFIKKNLNVKQF